MCVNDLGKMAIRYEYDERVKLLLLTFTGEVHDRELLEAYRKAQQISATHVVERGLLDGRGVTSFAVSPETMKMLAHEPTMLPVNSDRCVVAEQDYLFGMTRMYQSLGGESRDRLRVVRTMQEAYEYLQVQPPLELVPLD